MRYWITEIVGFFGGVGDRCGDDAAVAVVLDSGVEEDDRCECGDRGRFVSVANAELRY